MTSVFFRFADLLSFKLILDSENINLRLFRQLLVIIPAY